MLGLKLLFVVVYRLDAWVDIVAQLHLDAVNVIQKHTSDIIADLKNSVPLSQVTVTV